MTKIEKIFGGFLVLAIVAAASFLAFQNGLPTFTKPVTTAEVQPGAFTGVYKEDMCSCYEKGYIEGSKSGNITGDSSYSVDGNVSYRAGFSACRAAIGDEGGQAWSDGWANGETGMRTQRKCSFYLKKLNIR